jgi:hypothetical protein
MKQMRSGAVAMLLLSLGTGACMTQGVDRPSGMVPIYENVGEVGRVAGIGVDSNDVVGMTDGMMRDMLANRVLAGSATPPRVIIDASHFVNESSSRLSTNMIVDRLRNELIRAANGRMRFLSRESARMVETERALKRVGKLDHGAHGMADKAAGSDYELVGRITSGDSQQVASGLTSRHHYFHFEMVDLETSEIVWSGAYEFKKTAQDDVVYRGGAR